MPAVQFWKFVGRDTAGVNRAWSADPRTPGIEPDAPAFVYSLEDLARMPKSEFLTLWNAFLPNIDPPAMKQDRMTIARRFCNAMGDLETKNRPPSGDPVERPVADADTTTSETTTTTTKEQTMSTKSPKAAKSAKSAKPAKATKGKPAAKPAKAPRASSPKPKPAPRQPGEASTVIDGAVHRAGSRKSNMHQFYLDKKPTRADFIAKCESVGIKATTASSWYQSFGGSSGAGHGK